jgi:Adipocyte plasma membrane-associated protein-like, N-terminal
MRTSPPPYDLIPLPGEGPEDVVVGPDGMIYTGLAMSAFSPCRPRIGVAREVANAGGRRPLGDPIVRGVRARAGVDKDTQLRSGRFHAGL